MAKIKNFNYKKGEHLFCVGMTGSGKSYLINHLIKTQLKQDYIIFDIKGEDYEKLGAYKVKNTAELLQALKLGKRKILFQNEFLTPTILDKNLQKIYLICKNITVIVDEIHLYVTKSKNLDWIKQFVKVGRSKGKGFWGISQRGQDIHNDILTQSTHKLAGNISLEDKEYIAKKLNLNPDDFKNLEQYQFWYLKDIAGNKAEKIKA